MGFLYSRNFNARQPFNILLVENDEDDAFLFKRSLRTAPIAVKHVAGGNQAIRQLCGGEPLPDLIVLDLHLTGMSSDEFLDWVETQPEVGKVPVCLYTGASIIDGTLKRRVKAAFLKSLDPGEIRTTVEQMCAYVGTWRLPIILKLAAAAVGSALCLEAP